MGLTALLCAVPALADNANFGTLSLAPGFSSSEGIARGSTGGSFSLPAIANSDYKQRLCLGYAGDKDVPDHILVLQKNFAALKLKVTSGRNKTTLLVKGPDGIIRCGKDQIEDSNWAAGTYKVWVGALEAGMRRDYKLTVQE
ncbi:MAG: hypothetical protein VKJ46_00050 [Leptolyngbyaceae bacterium]|nr:hypothetical protein [Leptolyngbyaceae bacterium]